MSVTERRPRLSSRRLVGSIAVAAILLLAGAMFTTSARTARGTDLRSGGRGDLAELIRDEERTLREREDQLAALRAEIEAATEAASRRDARVAAARSLSLPVEQAAGMSPVTGPGLRVVLDDAPRTDPSQLPAEIGPDDLVVHQQDVQAVVNALWAGGAEAMQLMDQRVISTSAVRCVGNTLILQGRVYSPPYVITAVGPVGKMRDALDASDGVQIYRQYVDAVGLGYQVEAKDSLRLPAFSGGTDLLHAKPGNA